MCASYDDNEWVETPTIPRKRASPTYKPHSKFSFEEDQKLQELVDEYGENNWVELAKNMPNRNSRQCRERYLNYLSPRLNKGAWTKAEDELIMQKYEELGSRWVTIAQYFPDRTDAMIKNRFAVLQRQHQRKIQYEKEKEAKINNVVEQDEIISSPEEFTQLTPIETEIPEPQSIFMLDDNILISNPFFFSETSDLFNDDQLINSVWFDTVSF